MDQADLHMYESIISEARKRGFSTKITNQNLSRSEIGIYCQHVNFPSRSKFSAILLHDITQQFGRWPNIWLNEPWDKYDVGFLPGKAWAENWKMSSKYKYAHPKHGVYTINWPKLDKIFDKEFKTNIDSLKNSVNFNFKKTILYAPSWENDFKQDDFVQALKDLDVNLLIKQPPISEKHYPEMRNEINHWYNVHNKIKNVHILDPKTNVIDAIYICDIIVSDESSTMTEAVLMGKPAIAVEDWFIPDSEPKRPPVKLNYTVKSMKKDLKQTVKNVLENYDYYLNLLAELKFDEKYNKSSVLILDVIEALINNQKPNYDKLLSDLDKERTSIRYWTKRFKKEIRNYIYERYKI